MSAPSKKSLNLRMTLVLVIVAVISFFSASYFEQQQIDLNQARLNHEINLSLSEVTRDIYKSLEIYSLELKSLRSYIYNIGPGALSYQRFLQYAEDSNFELNYPGARGFGVVRYVPQAIEQEYVRAITEDRGESFEIKYLSEYNDSRFVIEFIEPEKYNAQAVGLDIGSEAHRRNAALTAAHKNAVTLTAPITLVQANAQVKHGFLLLYPVYLSSKVEGSGNAKEIFGWVYAPLLIDEILSAIQQHETGLSLSISDVSSGVDIAFFDGPKDQVPASMRDKPVVSDIQLFGREWRVKAYPSQAFLDDLSLSSPEYIFYLVLAVFILSALFILNAWYLLSRRFQDLRQKNELAAVVENGIEGTIGLDDSFCFKYWNEAAKGLLGFDDDVLHKPFLAWLDTSYSSEYLIDLFKRVSQGESVKGLELTLPAKDGQATVTYLHLNFQPIIQKGRFLGANISMVDLTLLRTLQNQLEEKNKSLRIKVSRQHDELKTTEGLHESLLQGADFLIIATDLTGKITSANRKLEEWLNYDHEEIVGQPVTQIVHNSTLEKASQEIFSQYKHQPQDTFEALVYQLKHQTRIEGECVFKNKNRTQTELQLSISTIRNTDNEAFGYLFIADDMSAQKALKFDLELVRSAIRNSEDIFLWLDHSGAIRNCNPHSWQSLGYSEYELRHMNINDLVSFGVDDSWGDMVNDLIDLGTMTDEKEFVTSVGKKIPCLITLAELQINNEVFFFVDGKNISDRLAKERALEDALNLAAQANLAKDEFLANMGHELRTPLNEVHGSLQLIKQTDLSKLQLEYLGQAKASVRLLTQSIDDVLDCGEIVRNKLQLSVEDIDLARLIESLGQDLSVLAENKNIEVHFDLANNLPDRIKTDPKRLQQLLMCLLSNAIKFTLEGDVILTCELKRTIGTQYELEFSVSDSGIGISQDKQQEIFEVFSQAEMAANRSFGGLGLGLTISKSIVELMSGQIRCHSIVDKGTTFTFTILVDKSEPQEQIHDDKPVPQNLHVLVVDDNEISLSVISKLIEQQRWRVTPARDAGRALDILKDAYTKQEKFDLALVDFNMPVMTGVDFISNAKAIFEESALPIFIMVTAYTRRMLSVLSRSNIDELVNEFLAKPITRSMLLDAVTGVLERPKNVEIDTTSANKRLNGFNILLVEDNETNQFIACNLLESQGANMTVAPEGESAWRLICETDKRFDIVLMDIQMPGWDGYKTTREIRADGRFNDLPILAMTANVLASDKKSCFDVGMDGHIGKPFELDLLIDEIIRLTKKKASEEMSGTSARLEREEPDCVEAENSEMTTDSSVEHKVLKSLVQRAGIDVDKALDRFSGSEVLYVQSLKLFQKELADYLEVLSDASQLVLIDVIKPIFHTLKGTAGLMGFVELSALALECDLHSKKLAKEGKDAKSLVSLIQLIGKTEGLITSILEEQAKDETESNLEKERELDQSKLDEFKRKLSASNMKALELYKEIKSPLEYVNSELAAKLEMAVMTLKFKEAVSLLEQLEQTFSEQNNAQNN